MLWITQILQSNHIPFQITGGLAAIAYGSTRELADIDIDIAEKDFGLIETVVKPYIIYGPQQFKNEKWDLLLMTLNYEGQEIDIGGAYTAKAYDEKQQKWVTLVSDLSTACYQNLFGIALPIVNKHDLIAYKKVLSRPVDLLDIGFLEENLYHLPD